MTKARGVMVVGDSTSVQAMFREYGWNVIFDSHKKARPHLICFTGGSDIDPQIYGEQRMKETQFIHRKRDDMEIKYFNEYKHVPKVGICRGGQLLNVLAGGSLYQDVNNHGRDHQVTDLILDRGSMVDVTSTHHQMMIPFKEAVPIAVAYEATKYVSGTPRQNPLYDAEVLWYERDNSLCFQPHPEYMSQKNNDCTEYFFDLLDYFYY